MVLADLNRLRMLRELDQRHTLAAVATSMGFSASAISQQLAVLEREAGQPLYEPAGRGVRLTEAGRRLAGHAETILAAASTAEDDLAQLAARRGEPTGTVHAVGLQSAARRLLIPALARLRGTHPGVAVRISELELEVALPELRLGTVDLVISDEYDSYPRPRPPKISRTLLLEEPTRLVLPADHPLARAEAVSMPQLRNEVWTSSNAGTGHHAMVVGTCRTHGDFEPDLRHRSNDADVQLELVRRTGAVTLLPDLTLPTADPQLAIRDIADTRLSRTLYAVTRTGPGSPATHLVLTTLAELCEQPLGTGDLTAAEVVVTDERMARVDGGHTAARPERPS